MTRQKYVFELFLSDCITLYQKNFLGEGVNPVLKNVVFKLTCSLKDLDLERNKWTDKNFFFMKLDEVEEGGSIDNDFSELKKIRDLTVFGQLAWLSTFLGRLVVAGSTNGH